MTLGASFFPNDLVIEHFKEMYNPEAAMEQKDNSEKKLDELAEKSNIVMEFLEFLGQNKKFWLIPIIIVLLLLGLIIALGGTSAAPFIYTLF